MFDEGRLQPDDLLDETGNVPPEVIRNAFRVLKPTADVTQYAVLWEKLWDDKQMEGFQVMGQWTRDHIPFPGRAFRETVELMREDALMQGPRPARRAAAVAAATSRWPILNVVAGQGPHRPVQGRPCRSASWSARRRPRRSSCPPVTSAS